MGDEQMALPPNRQYGLDTLKDEMIRMMPLLKPTSQTDMQMTIIGARIYV
jgi:hypothetical protein